MGGRSDHDGGTDPPCAGAVNHGGMYTFPVNGQTFPRVQVITVAQLLQESGPRCPPRSSVHRGIATSGHV
jgi:hypothetical protein